MILKNDVIVKLIIGLFILFYYSFMHYDPKAFFFISVVFIVYLVFYRQKENKITAMKDKIISFISKKEKNIASEKLWIDSKVYEIFKTPDSLFYTRKNAHMIKILYNMRFVSTYDEILFNKLIVHIEYFLKIHYKVLTGKYNYHIKINVLSDVRRSILNICNELYFSLPERSGIYGNNINNDMKKGLSQIQSHTDKCLRILHHKFRKGENLEGPKEHDPSLSEHSDLFV